VKATPPSSPRRASRRISAAFSPLTRCSPVIGVPMAGGALNGSTLSIRSRKMPGGVPVASMGIGKAGAKNAALFAVEYPLDRGQQAARSPGRLDPGAEPQGPGQGRGRPREVRIRPVSPESIRWLGDADGSLRLLDQTRLPAVAEELEVREVPALIEAIRLSWCAAARRSAWPVPTGSSWLRKSRLRILSRPSLAACPALRDARPTAVNLGWAIDRMEHRAPRAPPLHRLDAAAPCRAPSPKRAGSTTRIACSARTWPGTALPCSPRRAAVLTHCNTGACATGGIGTALGVSGALTRADPGSRSSQGRRAPCSRGLASRPGS
jgi:hypothetical protein